VPIKGERKCGHNDTEKRPASAKSTNGTYT
jgi:hypothetical protein